MTVATKDSNSLWDYANKRLKCAKISPLVHAETDTLSLYLRAFFWQEDNMNNNTSFQNIIIADDDPEMLLTVSTMVTLAGYQPISVQNFEAFKKNFSDSVSVVMLDLIMPGKDSEKIMQLLSDLNYQGPIILITGAIGADIVKRQVQADQLGLHICDVLIKPFWTDDVSRSLKSIAA